MDWSKNEFIDSCIWWIQWSLISGISGYKSRNNVIISISQPTSCSAYACSSLADRSFLSGYKMDGCPSISVQENKQESCLLVAATYVMWSILRSCAQPWTKVALAWIATLAMLWRLGWSPTWAVWTESVEVGNWSLNQISELLF